MVASVPFDVEADKSRPPTLGLVVLQADETIEDEFRWYLRDRTVVLHHTRIPSAEKLTHASLAAMEAELTAAVELFPQGAAFDTIGYACTSAAAVIGEQRVAALIDTARPGARASNPMTAAKAAFEALGVRRLGLLTPYSADVTAQLAETFAEAGYELPIVRSFDEDIEAKVARITSGSIASAVESLATSGNVDAIFVSCTNLRCAGIIAEAEHRTGVPTLSSNQVLLWHMLQISGIETCGIAPDRLFGVSLR